MAIAIDSVPGTRARTEPPRALEDLSTAGRAFMNAMRHHARRDALQECVGERWAGTPDWRLDRQVIRLGLFLRDRARLAPGAHVVVIAPLRRESLVAEWAAMLQGAIPVVLDPGLGAGVLAAAVAELSPRVVFVADSLSLRQLDGAVSAMASADVVAEWFSARGKHRIYAGDRPMPVPGASGSELPVLNGNTPPIVRDIG